jgi:hypothetical protein
MLQSNPLSYKLELPDSLEDILHVISVEHLEPAPAAPFDRPQPAPNAIKIGGVEKYIIDKLVDREDRTVRG